VYIHQQQGGVGSVWVLKMPLWELECGHCKDKFTHSTIDDTGMLSYHFPLKPVFPPGGSELECPNCGKKSTYQRTDLLYRA
jgi:hypothetical protein